MSEAKKLNLIEHISAPEKKQGYVNRMFEIIAPRYDFITVFLSYGMDRGWKRELVRMAALQGHEQALDLACGTGDITFALARALQTGRAIGLDITQGMLTLAEERRRKERVNNLAFQRADIMELPYPDQSFDCVTGGYALRNVPNVAGALAEIKRVLKPGGKFLSLDFGHPSNRLYRWAYLNYLIVVGSATGLLLHGDADMYRYIPESLKRYPGQQGVRRLMEQGGFVNCGFREFGGGIMAINYGTKPG
jgi:demethylmenaquinone methyltransferase/2-methoxy-6-polyprenyl-1,4-benzoquinol methylase